MSNKCRAKDPLTCQFHGYRAYKGRMESVAYYEAALKKAENFNHYEQIQERIAKHTRQADATETGMKKLQKAFQKSLRSGTPEEQIKFANRIKEAVALRVELEGRDRDWDDSWDHGAFGFTSLVMKKGSESDEVTIPPGNGTNHISLIADRLFAEEGYAVTDLNIRYIGAETPPSEERKSADKKRLVARANMGELRKWLIESDEIRGHSQDGWIYFEGITYSDPTGRSVTVQCRERHENL